MFNHLLPWHILTSIVTSESLPLYYLLKPACLSVLGMELDVIEFPGMCERSCTADRRHWFAHRCLPHFTHIQSTVFICEQWKLQFYLHSKWLFIHFLVCQCLGFFFNYEITLIFSNFHLFYHICKAKLSFQSPWGSFCSDLVCCNMENKSLNCYRGYVCTSWVEKWGL